MKNLIIKNSGSIVSNLDIKSTSFDRALNLGEPEFWIINPNLLEELQMQREKLKINSKKRIFLKKLNLEKVEARNLENFKKRSDSLAKYRIDFMPLCCDDDLEMMAYILNKDQEKKSS